MKPLVNHHETTVKPPRNQLQKLLNAAAGAQSSGILGVLHHEAADPTHPAVGLCQRGAGAGLTPIRARRR